VLFESPTAASLGETGELAWIVARNAPKERAFGFLPVLAHPIGGSNDDSQVHESALLCLSSTKPAALAFAREALERSWKSSPLERQALVSSTELVRCDSPGVRVVALKHNTRRDRLLLRLFAEQPPPEPARITLAHGSLQSAFLSDALERELSALRVEASSCVVVPLVQRTTSLLLRLH
jgi:hypothetical protein